MLRQQRRCVFVYEEKRNIYIENLFNKPSGDEFWKSLEALKKTNETGINKENARIVDENLRDLLIIKADEIVNDPTKINSGERESETIRNFKESKIINESKRVNKKREY
jgi:hypothetical protein